MKITVIATGFDRGGASRAGGQRRRQTPVDLSHYYARTRPQVPDPMSVRCRPHRRSSARPAIDLPQPMAMAAGGENQVIEGVDESRSPLDVPAFMRRQHEG